MNAFLRNGVHYDRVPHPDGGAVIRRFSKDAKIKNQMKAMLATLKERGEREILLAIIEKRKGFSLAQVFAHWPNRMGELRTKLSDVDVEPLVAPWIATVRALYPSTDTADQYHRQVRDLIPEGQPFASSALSIANLEAWVFSRPVSSGTQLRYHAAMSSFCEYLKRTKVIPTNPMREVPNPKASESRVRYLELADMIRVIEAQHDPYRVMSALAHSGVEFGACVTIRVRDVNPSRHTIHVRGYKTPWRNRVVYIGSWAWEYVAKALKGKHPDAYLCRVSRTPNRESHQKACKALGISDYRFHDGRHSYAVRLARAGTPLEVIAKQLGHKDLKMVQKCYGRFRPTEDDTARWEAIAAAREAEESAKNATKTGTNATR